MRPTETTKKACMDIVSDLVRQRQEERIEPCYPTWFMFTKVIKESMTELKREDRLHIENTVNDYQIIPHEQEPGNI